jgi:hypothetical protein
LFRQDEVSMGSLFSSLPGSLTPTSPPPLSPAACR